MFLLASGKDGAIIQWLEKNSQSCFYKEHFGIVCPGCGFQRSLIALLKGNLAESFVLFPALIPLILMGILLIAHLVFKLKHGATLLKILFFINVGLILGNYLAKLIL